MEIPELEREITPNGVPIESMDPPQCVELIEQPSDIGHSCHMYSFGLLSTDFSSGDWRKFFEESDNYYTFNHLVESGCIGEFSETDLATSNFVLYLGYRNNRYPKDTQKIRDLYVLHSAKKENNSFTSRMYDGKNCKIFSHTLGAVQKEYSSDGRFVFPVFCRLTEDKEKLKNALCTRLTSINFR